jgi:RNA polymerase sigma-70 factor (ECF subfamily)
VAPLTASTSDGPDHNPPRLTPPNPIDQQSERAFVERARQGDRDAFGALVRAHLESALHLAQRVLHSTEDAEDAVQDAFLLALQRLDQFDASRPFGPWLARIVVNRSIDLAESRRVRSTEQLDERAPDDRADALTRVESSELTDRVRAIAKSMPPRQRLIVELHDIEDWSVAEIAGLTGSSSATVRWHLHMGRRALRTALTPLYGKDN